MSYLSWLNKTNHMPGQSESHHEALQTDVMRFMAILAFCLVAVFLAIAQIPVTQPQVKQNSAAVQASALETLATDGAVTASDETVPDTRPILRFASEEALLELLNSGNASLFIKTTGTWKRWVPGPLFGFQASAPPQGALYRLSQDQVPVAFQQAASQPANSVIHHAQSEWLMQLPESTHRTIQTLLGDQPHGALAIDAQGTVTRGSSSTP